MKASVHAALAISQRHDAVAVLRRGDESPRVIAERGRWPAWNPDGTAIALSVVDHADDGAVSSRLLVLDAATGSSSTLFTSPPGVSPVIAARIPHYLSWSPDGRTASYVAMSAAGVALAHRGWPPDGPAVQVAAGAPLFSAWSPDSRYQAIHAAANLLVVDRTSPEAPEVVSDVAVGFRAPAYSDDSSTLAFAARAGNALDIRFCSATGDAARTVATFSSGVVIGFRPASTVLTVATAANPATGVFDALWLISEHADPLRIYRGPFVAYAWRPDGALLTMVVPTQTGDGRYAVYAVVPGEGVVAATEAVIPSDDYRALLGFFDQYLQSHRLWAPDGSAFVIAGRLPNDGVSASLGDTSGPYVWSWAADRGAPLMPVAAGTAAFFAPREAGVPPA